MADLEKDENIVDSPYDPRKVLAHTDRLKKILDREIPFPVTIEVDLVDGACNSKCIFCCFDNNLGKKPVFIDKKVLINALIVASANGVKAIELVGGSEPTMHPEILEIVEKIAGLKLELGLITNGLLLPRVFKVSKLFKFIRVSVDAGTSMTYHELHGVNCFEKLFENISLLMHNENKPGVVGLGYLYLPQNCKQVEIESFILKAISLNVDYVAFRPAILKNQPNTNYLGDIDDRMQDLRKKYGDKITIYSSSVNRWETTKLMKRTDSGRCLTCALTGVIMADGNVPYCNLARRKPELYIGNICQNNYNDIWNSLAHRKISRSVDIANCPIPCKANDYRKVLMEHKNTLQSNSIEVRDTAHPDFL